MISTGLHGFGRFAQHFLYAWLSDPDGISLDFACDEHLTAEAICDLLIQHDRLDFSSAMPQARDGELLLTRADGLRQRIIFHHGLRNPCITCYFGSDVLTLHRVDKTAFG